MIWDFLPNKLNGSPQREITRSLSNTNTRYCLYLIALSYTVMDALPRAIVLLLLVVTADIRMSTSSFCAAFIFHSTATTNNNSIISNVKTSIGGCRAESRIIKKNVNNFIAGQSNNCQFMTPPSSSSDDTNNNDAEQLQEAAAKLREEAQAAEELLSSSRSSKLVIEDVKPPVEYIDVKDSCWEIT